MSLLAQLGWLALALASALLFPLQAGVNASLGNQLGHPVLASLVSFSVGALAAMLLALVMRLPLPSLQQVTGVPIWLWTGGLMGVTIITAAIFAAPRLGAATFIAAVVGGQLISGLLLDQFGIAGYAQRPVTMMRVAGIVLILAGVLLVQFGQASGSQSSGQ